MRTCQTDTGCSHLLVAIRPEPTHRHFDPERVRYWVAQAGRGVRAEITLDTRLPLRTAFGLGTIRIDDALRVSPTSGSPAVAISRLSMWPGQQSTSLVRMPRSCGVAAIRRGRPRGKPGRFLRAADRGRRPDAGFRGAHRRHGRLARSSPHSCRTSSGATVRRPCSPTSWPTRGSCSPPRPRACASGEPEIWRENRRRVGLDGFCGFAPPPDVAGSPGRPIYDASARSALVGAGRALAMSAACLGNRHGRAGSDRDRDGRGRLDRAGTPHARPQASRASSSSAS